MKKIITVFLLLFPIIASANNDLEMRNQILDNQIIDLTNERDTKYEALQKCEKSTKGFKIAGLTTLVATGVGVYGNIKLSQKLSNKGGKSGDFSSERVIINKTHEEKKDDNCALLCRFGNAPSGCSCAG